MCSRARLSFELVRTSGNHSAEKYIPVISSCCFHRVLSELRVVVLNTLHAACSAILSKTQRITQHRHTHSEFVVSSLSLPSSCILALPSVWSFCDVLVLAHQLAESYKTDRTSKQQLTLSSGLRLRPIIYARLF